MIASRRTDLKLTLTLCYAAVVAIGIWLAILLLSQLALMEPVTAPGVQSLADNGEALLFLASEDAPSPEASYASARLWVWFCIGTNAIGAVLIGLWLRAAMNPLTPPARQAPSAAPLQLPNASLIERAMQHDRHASAPALLSQLPPPQRKSRPAAPAGLAPASASAASGGSDASLRLARVARIIDNLAFQTTLLAVNAAVEAERGSRLPPRA